MPAFEGLLEDRKIDNMIQDMLFELAMFYTFAKLAMHTETTLLAFEAAVTRLGKVMRDFMFKICPEYDTRELPRETESRKRRRKSSKASTKAKRKNFNLNTYKYHRLADYPRVIREIGTLDGPSTMTARKVALHPTLESLTSIVVGRSRTQTRKASVRPHKQEQELS